MEGGLTAAQEEKWRLAGVLGPVFAVATGCGWVTALLCSLAALVLFLVPRKESFRLLGGVPRWLWVTVLGVLSLRKMQALWPGEDGRWIPLIVLGLSLLGIWKGRDQAAQGGILLLWLAGTLLGAVLISAIPEIEMENLKPGAIWSSNGTLLLTVLLTAGAAWGRGRKTGKTLWRKLAALCLLGAVCAQGTLSMPILRETANPFYELSRSVDFLGTMKRMESLTVLGGLLACYLWLSYLYSILEERKVTAAAGLLSAALYLTGWSPNVNTLLIGILTAEYLLPALMKAIQK